jgi:ubiquinone/menaquinone biosynthesis C-methylase UbiE
VIGRIRDRLRGATRTSARFWANRHLETPEVWPAHWETRDAPYRVALVERLTAIPAQGSFLEVGCGNGPNLWALAQRTPGATLAGVDVSEAAIAYGVEALEAEGVAARLETSMADPLPFPDDSFDVVFTCGLLVCIGPDRIEAAMSELVRVARSAVLLLEGGSAEREVEDPYPNTMYWRRDYALWLREQVPGGAVRSEAVPPHLVHGHLDTYFELTLNP